MSDRQILKNQKGFTLLELMIVIAIISILALVLIPNFVLARNQAKISSCQSNIKLIATAIENYAVSNRDQYPDTDFIINDSSIIGEYLDRNIKCPQIKEYYKYKAPVGNSKYWVYCPTIDNTQKHRTNRGIVSKVYFDNQQGIKIEY